MNSLRSGSQVVTEIHLTREINSSPLIAEPLEVGVFQNILKFVEM
jgi:hypothetical protein